MNENSIARGAGMKHLFVINPLSFPAQAARDVLFKEIDECFTPASSDEYSILISRYTRDAIGLIRKWINKHQSDETVRVYAVGGDGILFDCVNGIVGLPNTELAAIPYGTANDFIRAFGENKNAMFRDIKLQVASRAIPTDIIHCGNNCAINFCAVGIEAYSIMSSLNLYYNISKKIRKYRKLNRFVYTSLFYTSGATAVFNKKILNQHYTIKIDGEDFCGAYGTFNIANGPCYGVNMNPVTTAMPDDGVLDALLFKGSSSLKAATIFPGFVKGNFRKFPDYLIWKRLKKIEIHSEDPILVNLDGEVFFDTSLTVEIMPQAIKFVAPGGIAYSSKEGAKG